MDEKEEYFGLFVVTSSPVFVCYETVSVNSHHVSSVAAVSQLIIGKSPNYCIYSLNASQKPPQAGIRTVVD